MGNRIYSSRAWWRKRKTRWRKVKSLNLYRRLQEVVHITHSRIFVVVVFFSARAFCWMDQGQSSTLFNSPQLKRTSDVWMIKMRTKKEKDREQWATNSNSSKVHLTNKISCQKTLLLTPYLQAVMKVMQSLILIDIFFLAGNTEPSLFQRVIGLFSSTQESEIQFSTNDIEMTTFKVVSGLSPNVLPAMYCPVANSLLNTPRRRGLYITALWSPVRKRRQHSVHKKCSKKLIFPSKDIILSRWIPSLTNKQFQEETWAQTKNQIKYSKMARVRILVHRTWAIYSICSPIAVADPNIQIKVGGGGGPSIQTLR